jgi:site-specific DNA recombinase
VIVTNPRYTGRQVWNKQRKQETLLDIEDVAAGYETKLKWNGQEKRIWSDNVAHEPLISVEEFEAAQALLVQRAAVMTRLPRDGVSRHGWCSVIAPRREGAPNRVELTVLPRERPS